MILATVHKVPGYRVKEVLGLAKGNTIRAQHLGEDIVAFFKNMVGGEISEYTKMVAEAREQALDRMVEDARAQGADAVIGVKFTNSLMQGAAELLAYGTAVKLEKIEG